MKLGEYSQGIVKQSERYSGVSSLKELKSKADEEQSGELKDYVLNQDYTMVQ